MSLAVMGLVEHFNDLEDGFKEGIGRGLCVATRDPSLGESRPEDFGYTKAFRLGERMGKFGGCAIGILFFDIPTLGILPLYNHFKYR